MTACTTLVAPTGATGFAYNLGSIGDVNGDGFGDVVVGGYDTPSRTGRALVFLGSATGITTTAATLSFGSGAEDSSSVFAVASAGDVNGDGFTDVIVGGDSRQIDRGRAWLYLGSARGVRDVPATVLTGRGDPEDLFGNAVAGVNDVNGDGFADVVVGARRYRNYTGEAYVYLGSASGLGTAPAPTLPSPGGADATFGSSVAGGGDVNGDGFADVTVGAITDSSSVGRAYLFPGGASGVATTPATTLTGLDGTSYFGASVARAGGTARGRIADTHGAAKRAKAARGDTCCRSKGTFGSSRRYVRRISH